MKKVNNSKTKKKDGNYTAVLLERMSDDIKLIAEGQIGVQRQLDEFKDDMREFKNDMHEFKDEMHEFKEGMLEFKRNTESNFGKIFEYLSRIEDEIVEIRKDLKDNYERKGWDKKWRNVIEKRLEKIERALTDKRLSVDAAA